MRLSYFFSVVSSSHYNRVSFCPIPQDLRPLGSVWRACGKRWRLCSWCSKWVGWVAPVLWGWAVAVWEECPVWACRAWPWDSAQWVDSADSAGWWRIPTWCPRWWRPAVTRQSPRPFTAPASVVICTVSGAKCLVPVLVSFLNKGIGNAIQWSSTINQSIDRILAFGV